MAALVERRECVGGRAVQDGLEPVPLLFLLGSEADHRL